MDIQKQHAKLLKTMIKADACLERDTAQKLIRKADRIHNKLKETDV